MLFGVWCNVQFSFATKLLSFQLKCSFDLSTEMMSVGGDIVSSGGSGASGGNVTTNISIPIEQQQQQQQSSPAQATNANHSTQSHANAIQSKMSDILKRKAPPKRKSQTSSRSKTRNQEHHTEQSSSVMQELMSKASALGK